MQRYKLNDIFEKQITGEWGKDLVDDKGVSIIRTTNFTNEGSINYDNVVRRDVARKKIETKILKQGDIIIEKSGGTNTTPTGRVVYCDTQIKNDIYLCNNFTQALRSNKNLAFPKYVFYTMLYLHKMGFTNKLQNKTTGIRNLQLEKYLETEIFLPPLPEQERIATELDTVCGVITKQKEQYKFLDKLIKSRFVEMFGDPKTNSKRLPLVKPKEICESISAGGDRPNEVSSIRTEEFLYPIYSNGEKDDGLYGWSKGYRIEKPAVTISGRGTIGFSCFRKDGRFTPIVRLIVIIPNEKINPIYLTYYMNFEREIGSGSGVQQLTVPMIKEKSIILPDIVDQNDFALFFEQVDKLKLDVQKSLDETQTLYKALMQKYFG